MSPSRRKSPEVQARLAAAEEQADALCKLLKRVVREREVTLRELGPSTGRSQDYWSKLLRGLRKLHVEHIYQALDAVGVEPKVFFTRLHADPKYDLSPDAPLDPDQAAQILDHTGEAARVVLQLFAQARARVGEG